MKRVTRKEMVDEISDRLGVTRKEAAEMFKVVIEIVSRELADANAVVMRDFGTFETQILKGRVGRNPREPEKEIRIPDRAVVKFSPGKELREKVARTLPILRARQKD